MACLCFPVTDCVAQSGLYRVADTAGASTNTAYDAHQLAKSVFVIVYYFSVSAPLQSLVPSGPESLDYIDQGVKSQVGGGGGLSDQVISPRWDNPEIIWTDHLLLLQLPACLFVWCGVWVKMPSRIRQFGRGVRGVRVYIG